MSGDGADPTRRSTGATRRAEGALALLLVGAGLCFAAFAVLIAVAPDTQLLGATAGGGLALLAAALILAGKRVVPQETLVEERPEMVEPEAQAEAKELLRASGEGVSRRGVLLAAAGTAGTGALAAAALPVTALGPSVAGRIEATPWRRGRLLVATSGEFVVAGDIAEGSFLTAFPEGADRRELGAPVVVVRVDPATLELPPERRDWAPEGLLAFSKICTHAACAVSLFRYPLYEPTSSRPALVCPCHYSTFDVRRGATVVFGPAGRALPQLPLRIDAARSLVAGGPMSDSIGPAWWGTDGGRM